MNGSPQASADIRQLAATAALTRAMLLAPFVLLVAGQGSLLAVLVALPLLALLSSAFRRNLFRLLSQARLVRQARLRVLIGLAPLALLAAVAIVSGPLATLENLAPFVAAAFLLPTLAALWSLYRMVRGAYSADGPGRPLVLRWLRASMLGVGGVLALLLGLILALSLGADVPMSAMTGLGWLGGLTCMLNFVLVIVLLSRVLTEIQRYFPGVLFAPQDLAAGQGAAAETWRAVRQWATQADLHARDGAWVSADEARVLTAEADRIPPRVRLQVALRGLPAALQITTTPGEAPPVGDMIYDSALSISGVSAAEAQALLGGLHQQLLPVMKEAAAARLSMCVLTVEWSWEVLSEEQARTDGALPSLTEAMVLGATLAARAAQPPAAKRQPEVLGTLR